MVVSPGFSASHTCMASLFLPRVLPLWEEATWAKYWITFFVFSVFPAPDSPLEYTVRDTSVRNTDWFLKIKTYGTCRCIYRAGRGSRGEGGRLPALTLLEEKQRGLSKNRCWRGSKRISCTVPNGILTMTGRVWQEDVMTGETDTAWSHTRQWLMFQPIQWVCIPIPYIQKVRSSAWALMHPEPKHTNSTSNRQILTCRGLTDLPCLWKKNKTNKRLITIGAFFFVRSRLCLNVYDTQTLLKITRWRSPTCHTSGAFSKRCLARVTPCHNPKMGSRQPFRRTAAEGPRSRSSAELTSQTGVSGLSNHLTQAFNARWLVPFAS